MTARRIHFTGRVQGVGFRATTRAIARRHPVRGYVRNLADGAVELVATGSDAAIAALVAEVQAAFEGNIESVATEDYEDEEDFEGFAIRR